MHGHNVVVDVEEHLRTRLDELAPQADRVLAAVSGGADSVALLRGLLAAGYEVAVAHLDHGLRSESADDARFVTELSARFGLEARIERVDVAAVARERGWNLEDAGRRVRYQFLTRSAREVGASVVLTGHTLDDQAETVLMQLLRGAAYLVGMAPVSRQVVRPLLDASHEELTSYLHSIGQAWREDPTNEDRLLLRAWLRHEVLPLLRRRYPAATAQLGRHALLQRDVADFVRGAAALLRREEGFEQAALLKAHPAVRREAVRSLFDHAGVAPAADQIEKVLRHLGQEEPFRLSIGPGVVLRLAYGRLEVARRAAAPEPRPVTSASQLPDGVPAAVLNYPDLVLRGRRPGDRVRLPGGSKSLARALIDRKVPREERDGLLVLASGSRILWAEEIGAAAGVMSPSSPRMVDKDEQFMERAMELGRDAALKGELPVGAVVTKDGEILGEGHNETESSGDPTAHAELLAMRRAAAVLGD